MRFSRISLMVEMKMLKARKSSRCYFLFIYFLLIFFTVEMKTLKGTQEFAL
jgi:hypothetical protein